VALVQQFEGKYLDYYSPPMIKGNTFTMSGKFTRNDITINNVSIFYDPPLQALTNAQLTTDAEYTDGYGLGERVVVVVPPPPEGQTYGALPPRTVVASKWETTEAGQFLIEANIAPIYVKGTGVFTVGIIGEMGGEEVILTNYSIVIK
jgi:hypothetical protein